MNFLDIIKKLKTMNKDDALVINCETKELSDNFILNLDSYSTKINIINMENFIEYDKFKNYKDKTCYFLTKKLDKEFVLEFADIEYSVKHNHIVYKYEFLTGIDWDKLTNSIEDTNENNTTKEFQNMNQRLERIENYLKEVSNKLDNLQITL